MCSRFSCVASGLERFSLDLIEAVKNVVGVLECLEFIIAD